MAIEFVISALIPATPYEVYRTWLSSEGHTQMTGGSASINADWGGEFEAWDGYIHGQNLELEPGKRIVQSWRTSEFNAEEPDSRIEITLEAVGELTKLTLLHTDLPSHGMQYEQGWMENYFEPMIAYFSGSTA